ncbi:MAG: DUF4365 domain-containing protein [Tepidisphaeraceae bacterium]|jgi:hypothetical protein
MSLTENNVKAELSYAALHAVAAQCGFGCSAAPRHEDDGGVDATVHIRAKLDSDSFLKDFHLNVQLKATSHELSRPNDRYSYPLTSAHYNKLRDPDVDIQRVLVVLLLPDDRSEWLRVSPLELVLKGRLRWTSIRNAPALSEAQQSVTIGLPDGRVLTPATLRELAVKRSKGEWVDHAI